MATTQESFEKLVDTLQKPIGKQGLYLDRALLCGVDEHGRLDSEMVPDDSAEMVTRMADGEKFVVVFNVTIGDRAFTPKVEDPETAEVAREIRDAMPSEADIVAEDMREKLAGGADIEDLFDIGDDPDA